MTDQTVAEMLNRAADHIAQYGHVKGTTLGDGGWGESPACVVGAITVAAVKARHSGSLQPACDAMRDYLGGILVAWNDAPERTADEVIETLRAAAIIAAAQEVDVRVVAPEAELTAVSLADVAGAGIPSPTTRRQARGSSPSRAAMVGAASDRRRRTHPRGRPRMGRQCQRAGRGGRVVSAEILREAAALMRERAEAARDSAPPMWDEQSWGDVPARWYEPDALSGRHVASVADSAHIASWHPAVALAVADWLDAEAAAMEAMAAFTGVAASIEHEVDIRGAALTVRKDDRGGISLTADTSRPALAVAAAYLAMSEVTA